MKELHSIMSKDVGDIFSIEMRKNTCFCEFCIDAKGCALYQCENDGYVKQWNMSLLIHRGHIQFQHHTR
jgi:hypothetical protein